MHLFLFDCDGTLLDSQNSIVKAMEKSFDSNGLQAPSRQDILSIVGLSLDEAIAALYPPASEEHLKSMVNSYKQAYLEIRASEQYEDPLYEGTVEMLQQFAGYNDVVLGVATGKSRRGLLRVLSQYDLGKYFITLQTADDAPSKPHPAMIERAIMETGVEISNTVMIGDTTYDISMAQNAGVTPIGVSWGYHKRSELHTAGAQHIMNDMTELSDFLSSIYKSGLR